jgi:hypothetical protein
MMVMTTLRIVPESIKLMKNAVGRKRKHGLRRTVFWGQEGVVHEGYV